MVWSLDVGGDAHGYNPAQIAFSHDGKLLAATESNMEVHVWEMATGMKIRTFAGHIKPVTSLAFAPDASTLLTGSEDGTMLLWQLRDIEPAKNELSAKQLLACWSALADSDAVVANGAMNRLLETPGQTIEFLKTNLTPEPVNSIEALPDLIERLQSGDVEVSLRSAARLLEFGVEASPVLFQALAKTTTPENRERIERLLERIGEFPVPAETLRRSRAIQLLDGIGGDESLNILKTFVAGNPDSATAKDATAVIRRIERKKYLPNGEK
jgi:hypothetical protein